MAENMCGRLTRYRGPELGMGEGRAHLLGKAQQLRQARPEDFLQSLLVLWGPAKEANARSLNREA